MFAIHTQHLPATSTKGPKVKAYTNGGFSFSIPVPYRNPDVRTHFDAVRALIAHHRLHDWDLRNMRVGDSSDGNGYTFCFDDSKVPQ